jgi:hypothetical protein
MQRCRRQAKFNKQGRVILVIIRSYQINVRLGRRMSETFAIRGPEDGCLQQYRCIEEGRYSKQSYEKSHSVHVFKK